MLSGQTTLVKEVSKHMLIINVYFVVDPRGDFLVVKLPLVSSSSQLVIRNTHLTHSTVVWNESKQPLFLSARGQQREMVLLA